MPPEHVSALGGKKYLQSLADNPVTITGKIALYKATRLLRQLRAASYDK
jgi:hypothetical protein